MTSERLIDRKRGTRDARQQLALLREKWPVAFPAEPESVRPLAIGVAGEIASAMGWSLPYTLGVLARWKMAPAYCRAVLAQERRDVKVGKGEQHVMQSRSIRRSGQPNRATALSNACS